MKSGWLFVILFHCKKQSTRNSPPACFTGEENQVLQGQITNLGGFVTFVCVRITIVCMVNLYLTLFTLLVIFDVIIFKDNNTHMEK